MMSSRINSAKKHQSTRFQAGLFLASLLLMVGVYATLYDHSIDWEVVSTARVVEFPALTIEGGIGDHEIMGENYVLEEQYAATRIKRSWVADPLFLGGIWMGICLLASLATHFNRYLFFAVLTAFVLMIYRLNLFEVPWCGVRSRLVTLVPILGLGAPLVYFHAFNRRVPYLLRVATLLVVSAIFCLGVSDLGYFTDHLIAHFVFPLSLILLLFLFLISEQFIFGLLYLVTSSKGKNNHLHFTALSLIYLINLGLYYLNKIGVFPNDYSFFDPYVLFTVSCVLSIWSFSFKSDLHTWVPADVLKRVLPCLGLICVLFLSLSMFKGIDAIHQSFHYFILYFHLGFGLLFLLYVLANFLDPLIQGFPIWKIVYKERNFPFATAKIGGLVCVAAFYFYSGQEPYHLLRSGYYNYLGNVEQTHGNPLLAKEYWIQASFLGYNTHYPNYQLAWIEWDRNQKLRAKSNFFNAAQRYPSAYAWVNYGNLALEDNPSKVQAVYKEALRTLSSAEMENNLGLIYLQKGNPQKALDYFERASPQDRWNDAPNVNKWGLYRKDEVAPNEWIEAYQKGNYGVKANMISGLDTLSAGFLSAGIEEAMPLHRQAYLMKAAYLMNDARIEPLLLKTLDPLAQAPNPHLLRKALAIHLYKKGEVNQAFRMLDILQTRAKRFEKGPIFDIMGKLALDQNAYQIAREYFDKALADGYTPARLGQLEAHAALRDKAPFEALLSQIVNEDTGLTSYANTLLDLWDSYLPVTKLYPPIEISALSDSSLLVLASKNAFDEALLLRAVDELNSRKADGAYDVLVEAIEINKYNPAVLKAYVISALEWGLDAYAQPVLDRLKPLISQTEYAQFSARCEALKRANEASWAD